MEQLIIIQNKKEEIIKFIKYLSLNIAILTILELLTRSITNTGIYITSSIFIIFYSVIFTSILMTLKRNIRKITIGAVYAFIIIYYFAQAIHFGVFKNFIPFAKIIFFREVFAIRDNISINFEFRYLLYILPVILAILFFFFVDKKIKEKNRNKKIIIVYLIIIMGFLGIYILSNNIYFRIETDNAFLREQMVDNNDYIKKYGMIDYLVNDIIRNIKILNPNMDKNNGKKQEQIDAYFEEKKTEKNSENEMTNIFKDKNLIFITAESLGVFGIDENLTKTLYKLKQEGMYFENYYASNVGTIDAEFTLLTSLMPTYNKGMVSYTYANNSNKYSMPSIFKQNGYATNAYHNYTDKYYNRNFYMPTLGFESYKGMEDLGIDKVEEGIDDFPKDIDLFRNSFDLYKDEEKFFSYYMTVSGHGSYYAERRSTYENFDKATEFYGEEFPQVLRYYIAAQMLLDEGMEYLMDRLEETGLIENTVIVIVGDHYPYLIDDGVAEETYNITNELDIYKVPLIIWSKDIEGKTYSEIINILDVYPSLGNLFGIDTTYTMGVDFFYDKSETMVKWNNQRAFSFLNKDVYYDRVLNKIYNNGNLTEEEIENIIRQNYMEYQISQWIIETNYFSNR